VTQPPKPADALRAFAHAFFEGAGPALTTLLNRSVTIGDVRTDAWKPTEILEQLPLPWALAECQYSRGLTGKHWIVVPLDQAGDLGATLTAEPGDTGAGELSPAHVDAVVETTNVLLSGAAATLMPLLARSVAFASPTLSVVTDVNDLPQDLAPQSSAWVWVLRARATAPGGFTLELTVTVGQDLAREIVVVGTQGAAVAATAPEPATAESPAPSRLDLIMDISLPLTVELGRARLQIQDLLRLAPGSVIELDKSAGDPVELLINDRPIAKGEVVVIDENFGIRLTSIVTPTERIRSLR
jgi:flagellar motor switch protein FliN/FliY